MDRWVGKVAVVTGASAGIGYAIAKKLAEEGMIVVAVARREERLKELAANTSNAKGGKIIPHPADVTKENEVVQMIQKANDLGGVHVLVNNAGTALKTNTIDGDIDKWRWMFELNVLSTGAAMREAIKWMRQRSIDGHIINISSISATGIPTDIGKHVYNASKHALRLVTEGIRRELAVMGSNIKISMVSPGCVATEIFEVGSWSVPPICLESEDVALACVQVLATPPTMQVTEYIVRPVGETVPA